MWGCYRKIVQYLHVTWTNQAETTVHFFWSLASYQNLYKLLIFLLKLIMMVIIRLMVLMVGMSNYFDYIRNSTPDCLTIIKPITLISYIWESLIPSLITGLWCGLNCPYLEIRHFTVDRDSHTIAWEKNTQMSETINLCQKYDRFNTFSYLWIQSDHGSVEKSSQSQAKDLCRMTAM